MLVRDWDKQMWKCDFYNSHVKELNTPFRTISSWYKQCIPYNEETKHLVDTNEMPPKKYITWEKFESVCKKLSGHSDIFYGTNNEVFFGN